MKMTRKTRVDFCLHGGSLIILLQIGDGDHYTHIVLNRQTIPFKLPMVNKISVWTADCHVPLPEPLDVPINFPLSVCSKIEEHFQGISAFRAHARIRSTPETWSKAIDFRVIERITFEKKGVDQIREKLRTVLVRWKATLDNWAGLSLTNCPLGQLEDLAYEFQAAFCDSMVSHSIKNLDAQFDVCGHRWNIVVFGVLQNVVEQDHTREQSVCRIIPPRSEVVTMKKRFVQMMNCRRRGRDTLLYVIWINF